MKATKPKQNSSVFSVPKTSQLKSYQQFYANDFSPAICHKLRTALNSVIGFSEILKHEVQNPKSAAECVDYASEMNRAASELSDLVNGFLGVSATGLEGLSVADMAEEDSIEN